MLREEDVTLTLIEALKHAGFVPRRTKALERVIRRTLRLLADQDGHPLTVAMRPEKSRESHMTCWKTALRRCK